MSPNPPSQPIPVLMLGLLLLAAALLGGAAGALLVDGAPRAEPAPAAASAAPGEVAALLVRIERLEADLARAAPAVARTSEAASAPAVREPAPAAVDGTVQRRLDALENALAAIARSREAVAPSVGAPRPALPELAANEAAERERRLAAGQQAILDPRSDEKAKLAGWSQLRHVENSWNDAVVTTMTQLGLSAVDPAVRADVWRQADGRSTHPAMAQALLQALQLDREPKVREEAAETLENYLDAHGVRQALEAASSGDADEGVRRQASNSLRAAERRR